MNSVWVVEFLHSLGWTPYSVHPSRKEARAQVALEKRRHEGRFDIRASKFERATVTVEVKHD